MLKTDSSNPSARGTKAAAASLPSSPRPIDLAEASVRPRRRGDRRGVCTDPIVGAILSGWRFDISGISPEMRTDYEQHLAECEHCHYRQRAARKFDVLLITGTTLSIVAFLLVAVVLHRFGQPPNIEAHVTLLHKVIAISLEAVAIAGVVISTVLWMLVAVATPLPDYFSGVLQERLPTELVERFARRHA